MLQLWHPVDETWEPVFRGHIDDVPSDLTPGAPELANRELDCVGIFDYLAGGKMVRREMGDALPAGAKIDGDGVLRGRRAGAATARRPRHPR